MSAIKKDLIFEDTPLKLKTIVRMIKYHHPYLFLFSFAGSLFMININDNSHIKVTENLPVIQNFSIQESTQGTNKTNYTIFAFLNTG